MTESITAFISYPRALERIAAEIAGVLRANGYSIWIDVKDFRKEMDAHSQLRRAIEDCDYFLSIVPLAGEQSYWVRFENSIAARTCTVLADSCFFRGNRLEVRRKEGVETRHPDDVMLDLLKQMQTGGRRCVTVGPPSARPTAPADSSAARTP
ncbi:MULTISPECIES: toll/interleukin-1 receptor domain-containing protein [Streptomyces]|uniref:toll/interleukin-1 receptor domain-containing protein n=1 Tax=Streptomyces TaxID=1883 RepID=UPI00292F6CF9|nr:toll/interleukin-1 receptor domain-containing protein [Streptomyces sp. NEAU-HV9]